MSKFTPIAFGSAGWDQIFNKKVEDLYNGGSVTDSGWKDCATLMNGAKPFAQDKNKVLRRVLDFGKFKLVQIKGQIEMPKDNLDYNNLPDTPIVTLPAGLPPFREINKLAPSTYRSYVRYKLTYNGQQILILHLQLDDRVKNTNDLWFPIEFMYISQ